MDPLVVLTLIAPGTSHRGRFPTAHQTFSSLPAHYTGNKWPPLEAFMLARNLDSHRQLGKLKDKEWLKDALTFLKAWTIVGGSGGPQALALPLGAGVSSADDRRAYMEGMVKDIIDTARTLSERKPVFCRCLNSITLSFSSARDREAPYLLYTNTREREVLRPTRWLVPGGSRSESFTLCK